MSSNMVHIIWKLLYVLYSLIHSDYRTVTPYWVLPVYVELIRAVLVDNFTMRHHFRRPEAMFNEGSTSC
jgi:hypothetical protein